MGLSLWKRSRFKVSFTEFKNPKNPENQPKLVQKRFKVITKEETFEFNRKNDIKDAKGNVRPGVTGKYYAQVRIKLL